MSTQPTNEPTGDLAWDAFMKRHTNFGRNQLMELSDKEYFDIPVAGVDKTFMRSSALLQKEYVALKSRTYAYQFFKYDPATEAAIDAMNRFQTLMYDVYFEKAQRLLQPVMTRDEFDNMPFLTIKAIVDTLWWEQENGRPLSSRTSPSSTKLKA